MYVPPAFASYAVDRQIFYRAEIDRRIIPIVGVQCDQIVLRMPRKIFYRSVFHAAVYVQPVGKTVFKTDILYIEITHSAYLTGKARGGTKHDIFHGQSAHAAE